MTKLTACVFYDPALDRYSVVDYLRREHFVNGVYDAGKMNYVFIDEIEIDIDDISKERRAALRSSFVRRERGLIECEYRAKLAKLD